MGLESDFKAALVQPNQMPLPALTSQLTVSSCKGHIAVSYAFSEEINGCVF